jgi:DNA-binding transcriptional regulator YdaS (Cro superfamily)
MHLSAYLEREHLTNAGFAARLGVTAEAVRLWALGRKIPRRDTMAAIEAATGGAVTARDFYSAEVPSEPAPAGAGG